MSSTIRIISNRRPSFLHRKQFVIKITKINYQCRQDTILASERERNVEVSIILENMTPSRLPVSSLFQRRKNFLSFNPQKPSESSSSRSSRFSPSSSNSSPSSSNSSSTFGGFFGGFLPFAGGFLVPFFF